MKKIILFLSIPLLLFFYTCKESKYKEILTNNIKFTENRVILLQENIKILGEISSFSFIEKDKFLVASEKTGDIIIYDNNGFQIRVLNKIGNGPGEYVNPSIVKSFNKKIYVWDDRRLNLLLYDTLGTHIYTFSNVGIGVRDFITSDNDFFFYMTGGQNNLICSYNLQTETIENVFGNSTEEHKVLSTNKKSGGMIEINKEFLIASSSELDLKLIGYDKSLKNTFPFQDSEFKVERVSDAINLFNIDRDKAMAYLMKNSYINGLYKNGNYIILVAKVGEIIKEIETYNFSKRFTKYYIFDQHFKYKGAYKVPFEPMNEFLFANQDEEKLFGLKYNNNPDIEAYELYELNFNIDN
jgi:WD40 repeat protein